MDTSSIQLHHCLAFNIGQFLQRLAASLVKHQHHFSVREAFSIPWCPEQTCVIFQDRMSELSLYDNTLMCCTGPLPFMFTAVWPTELAHNNICFRFTLQRPANSIKFQRWLLVNLKYTSHNLVLQPSLPRAGEIPTGHNYPAKHVHQTPGAWEHVWRATALIHSHSKLHCIGTK